MITPKSDPAKFMLIEIILKENYGWECFKQCDRSDTCTICYDEIKNKYVLGTPCGHFYHADCILMHIINNKSIKCCEPDCGKGYRYLKGPYSGQSSGPTRESPKGRSSVPPGFENYDYCKNNTTSSNTTSSNTTQSNDYFNLKNDFDDEFKKIYDTYPKTPSDISDYELYYQEL
jgi:hypothetical protein